MCPTVMLDICCDLFATITCSLQLVEWELNGLENWDFLKSWFEKVLDSSKTYLFLNVLAMSVHCEIWMCQKLLFLSTSKFRWISQQEISSWREISAQKFVMSRCVWRTLWTQANCWLLQFAVQQIPLWWNLFASKSPHKLQEGLFDYEQTSCFKNFQFLIVLKNQVILDMLKVAFILALKCEVFCISNFDII